MEKSKNPIMIIKQERPAVRRAATIFTLTEGHPDPSDLLDDLGVIGHRHYSKKPSRCSICRCSTISTLEIVGISEEPLFWECEDCGALFCKEKKEWICSEIVDKLYSCWTTPEDWEEVPDREDYS